MRPGLRYGAVLPLAAGTLALLIGWLGPLPGLASASFTAHMGLHLLVVAVAAPLLALGLCRLGDARAAAGAGALPASAVELIVVWAWHTPGLHRLAREGGPGLALEQLSFLLAGLLLWRCALQGLRCERARGAGIAALLLTATHMALLGALLALAPRPLYALDCLGGAPAAAILRQQHQGGVLMLLVGGSVYLAGALALLAPLLRDARAAR